MDTPISYATDSEGNFTDPRADQLFNDWCDGDAQKSLFQFFEFLAEGNAVGPDVSNLPDDPEF